MTNSKIDLTSWITGLMAENYNALGFIPNKTVENRYIGKERYVLGFNDSGKLIGYLLHGAAKQNRPLVISQAVIDYDFRLRRFGQNMVNEVIKRGLKRDASFIRLRCASDLEAVSFWKSCGFVAKNVTLNEGSGRWIIEFRFQLKQRLF